MDNQSTAPSPWPSTLGSIAGYGLGFFLGALWAGQPYTDEGFGTFGFAAFVFAFMAIMITSGGVAVIAILNVVLGHVAAGRPAALRGFAAVWATSILFAIALVIWQWSNVDRMRTMQVAITLVVLVGVVSGLLALLVRRLPGGGVQMLVSFVVCTVGLALGLGLLSEVLPI